MSETEVAAETLDAADGFEWCVVEIFGHRRHAGRGREEERFGSKMLRIDVPIKGDPELNGWETHFYSGGSLFSYTLSTEETVMRMNKPYEPASRYQLPAPAEEDIAHQDDDDV
jgi:hypothetical protein